MSQGFERGKDNEHTGKIESTCLNQNIPNPQDETADLCLELDLEDPDIAEYAEAYERLGKCSS